MRNKKATIDDKIYLLFLVGTVVAVLGVLYIAYTPFYNSMVALGTAPANAMSNIPPNSVYGWVDWTATIFYFAINILICILLPMMVRHNPIYIVALFLFSFIYAYICAILANSLVEFLEGVSASYTHILFVLNNFVLIEIVFLLLMSIIMFYKHQAAGGEMYYE